MPLLYQQSVPPMIKSFEAISAILTKAVAFADERGMKHQELLESRLASDMRPLTYQIQSMSNTAKFLCVRVGGLENTVLPDDETTFEQLQTRIQKKITILRSLDEHAMDGVEEKEVIVAAGMGKFRIPNGIKYVSEYAVPNFHFHMASAYCILRHLGVSIGAFDYMKGVFEKVEE